MEGAQSSVANEYIVIFEDNAGEEFESFLSTLPEGAVLTKYTKVFKGANIRVPEKDFGMHLLI